MKPNTDGEMRNGAGDALDALVARGEATSAHNEISALRKITLTESIHTSAQILRDARGRW